MPLIDPSEAKIYLARTQRCSERDLGLIHFLLPLAEAGVEDYLGYAISQQTHTEFYPSDDDDAVAYASELLVVTADHVQFVSGSGGQILALENTPVRSIQNVWVDYDGYFGQTAGAFASLDLLVAGVDYYLAVGRSGISKSGHLHRRGASWPMTLGSIKVEYTAGHTDAELGGKASAFREAVLITLADKWARCKQLETGLRPEAMSSESIGGGVSASYLANVRAAPIPDAAVEVLEPHINYANLGV